MRKHFRWCAISIVLSREQAGAQPTGAQHPSAGPGSAGPDASGAGSAGPDASGVERGRPDSARRASIDVILIALGYGVGYAYPLISLPFLARVLGASRLGELMLLLAALQIIVFITDFGFATSALRRGSDPRIRADRDATSRLLMDTCFAKTLLWLACMPVLAIAAVAVPMFTSHTGALAIGVVMILLGAWHPAWLLQAHGRVLTFALLMGLSRLLALVGLLLTVRGPGDLFAAVGWQLAPQALAATIAWLLFMFRWRTVVPRRPTRAGVRLGLREAAPLFAANASALVSGTAGSLSLGAVSTPVQVAWFGAAERFGNAARGVLRGAFDAMLARYVAAADAHMRRVAILVLIAGFWIAAAGLVVGTLTVLPWYLGPGMTGAEGPTLLFAAALLPAGAVAAFVLRAAAHREDRAIARIAAIAAVAQLCAVIPAAHWGGAVGVATVIIAVELLQTALHLIHRRRTQESHHDQPEHPARQHHHSLLRKRRPAAESTGIRASANRQRHRDHRHRRRIAHRPRHLRTSPR